ncbi:FlxA-like family protein [Dokdonella soli]|uniref:FlxA-like family protein n=2 Tax=Dokdonella soli TaxID=529810 RepID=A0ABP3TRR1_9GAMM
MAALSVALLAATAPAHADEGSLRQELAAMRAELSALKAEVNQLRAAAPTANPSTASIAATQPATSTTTAPMPAAGTASVAAAPASSPAGIGVGDSTRLWGYGELNYNRPTSKASAAKADVRRAVIGFSHAFDEDTHVYGELEWEHAVVSATDSGESEVEQLYVEHQVVPAVAVRAGLSLIPLGFINERHEPTNYYGVERNFVETAIIPSTWREGGVSLLGSTDSGLSWNVGLTTGFNLGKWDATATEGRASPLFSIHQEMQLAKARDVSMYAAANWQGIPGFTVGGGVFTGGVGQGQKDFLAKNARLTLGEAHVRWQPGPFDLSALYARGQISDTEALNLSFVGHPTPVPKSFWGGYVQGAWRVWQRGDSSLAPFLRYEAFNTAASYAPVPQGLGVPTADTERVWTVGLNYYLTPSVVFKADYQHFNIADEVLGYGNRFDLGVGYQF